MQNELCLENPTPQSLPASVEEPSLPPNPLPPEPMESLEAARKKKWQQDYYQRNKERIKLRVKTKWREKNPNWDKIRRTKVSPAVDKEFILNHVIKDPKTGCWNWAASINSVGYGELQEHNKKWMAHRKAYEIWFGPIPKGMLACHHCDNRSCANPFHIFIGTYSDNMQDASSKGRLFVHDRKLTDQQIVAIRADTRLQKIIADEYGINQRYVSQIKLLQRRASAK